MIHLHYSSYNTTLTPIETFFSLISVPWRGFYKFKDTGVCGWTFRTFKDNITGRRPVSPLLTNLLFRIWLEIVQTHSIKLIPLKFNNAVIILISLLWNRLAAENISLKIKEREKALRMKKLLQFLSYFHFMTAQRLKKRFHFLMLWL